MSEDNNATIGPNNSKRKMLFIIGLLIGLLLGGLLAMLLVDWLDYKRPTVVKVLERTAPSGTKDTVVNYVVHKYESQDEMQPQTQDSDTLMLDSTDLDEDYQDFMLDEDDIREWRVADDNPQNVMEDKLLKKSVLKIVYLDENKRVITNPTNASAQCQVQQWSTPIKNRLSYQFSNNVLKVKGLDVDNIKIIHYDNRYYLQSGNHVYLINPNKQFDKMLEVVDVSFTLR